MRTYLVTGGAGFIGSNYIHYMFKKYDIGDERGESVFRFVYDFAAPYPPVETLPENTTLQRRLKAYMLSGKRVYNQGGTISREELTNKLKEFEA